MPITAVPGFFSRRSRQRKPSGVDVIFTTDQSGSMGPLVDFINQSATVVALETALLAENVGVLVPNRYNKSSMQNLSTSAGALTWVQGSDLLVTPTLWNGWTATGFRWGQSQEDVTGSAFRVANTLFPYGYDTTNNPATNGSVFEEGTVRALRRSNAAQIIIAGSDEQDGATQYHTTDVYTRITAPETSIRYVALSSIGIALTPGLIPPAIAAETKIFGVVFTTPSTWFVILKPNVGASIDNNTPLYYSFPSSNFSFFTQYGSEPATSIDSSSSGPILTTGSFQVANTAKMARGTGGALYTISQFFEANGPTVFGGSLGLVLGSLLFELE